MKRLPRIFLAFIRLAAGVAAAKLVVPPLEVWQSATATEPPAHSELPITIFRIGDLLERNQLPTIDSEISEIQSASRFDRYSNRRGELVQLIETKIDPDSWMDSGAQGPVRGRIHGAGDALIVTQTPANTKAIDAFLESLRNGGGTKNAKTESARSGN